jgi:hypothetical protein
LQLFKVKQHFPRPHIPLDQIETVVCAQLEQLGLNLRPGGQIAIAVGSRGIANLARIVQAMVNWVKTQGAQPFIVPAMGSHGGATAEGQEAILASYGITEAAVGGPIRSAMDVVELPQDGLTNRVYFARDAYEADGTILINRVKVHTDYHGPTESGLLKMCVIGLGKHKGALELHSYGTHGLRDLIPPTARQILKHGKILAGLALTENAYEETARIKALRPQEMETEEQRLLDWVRAHMPALPVTQLDVLIIDEFGKNISGVGLDPNIIGRLKIKTEPEPTMPDITSILLLDLTSESHGNAIGMGLADLMTRQAYNKIDFQATYENVLTSGFYQRGFLPIVVANEAAGIEYGLRAYGLANRARLRVIKIKNTLRLDELWVSASVLAEIRALERIEMTAEVMEIAAP